MILAPRAWFGAALAASVALFLVLAIDQARQKSATYDEPIYISAGTLYLAEGNTKAAPRFGVLALPAALDALLLPRLAAHPTDGDVFMREAAEQRTVTRARAIPIAFGAALVALVGLLARRRFGDFAGGVAAALAASTPDIVAHGGLATTDVFLAFFALVAAASAAHVIASGRWKAAPGVILGAAGAAASKHAALPMLVPGLGAVWIAASWARGRPLARAVLEVAAAAAAAALLAALTLAPGGMPLYDYLASFAYQVNHASEGQPAVFLGAYSATGGFHAYYPVLFAVKTPIPLMLLAAAGAAWWLARGEERRLADLAIAAPAAALGAALVVGRLNMGSHYFLPCLPAVLLAAAAGAAALGRRGAAGKAVVAGLLLWQLGGTLENHPDHIAYFNEIVGGPAGGRRIAVDSSLDWGQDLAGLARWLEARGATEASVAYFGTADPEAYGIRNRRFDVTPEGLLAPRARYVAVSVSFLEGLHVPAAAFGRIREREPVAVIGHTIYVYDFEER